MELMVELIKLMEFFIEIIKVSFEMIMFLYTTRAQSFNPQIKYSFYKLFILSLFILQPDNQKKLV
jgi:hypothetical protein